MNEGARIAVARVRTVAVAIVLLVGLMVGCGGGGGSQITAPASDNGAVAVTPTPTATPTATATPSPTPSSSPTPARVDVTPVAVAIPLGATQAFTATATWGDGTTSDVTTKATWSSSDPLLASIDAGGVAWGLNPGTVTMSAVFGGVTGKATLIVNTPGETVTQVMVTPVQATVSVGGTQQFMATATFADGHQRDVTSGARWATGDAAIATIWQQGGLATGVSTGSTTVTATYGRTGQATIDVVP